MHGLFVCVGYCFPFSLKQFKDNLDVCAKIDAIRLCMWTGVSQWRLYNTHSETFILAGKPGTYNLSKMSERNLLINWYPFYDMPNYSRKLSRHPNTWAAFIYGTLPFVHGNYFTVSNIIIQFSFCDYYFFFRKSHSIIKATDFNQCMWTEPK